MYTFPPNTHRLAAWPSPSTSGASNFAWCNPWGCGVLEWYRPSWAGASHSRVASETKLPICLSMFGLWNGIPTDLHGIQVSNVKQTLMKFLLCIPLYWFFFIGILKVGCHNPCISFGGWWYNPLYTANKLRRVLVTAQVILQPGGNLRAGWGSSGGYAPPPSKPRFPTLPSIHTSWPRLLVEWWDVWGESRENKKRSKKLPSRWWPTPFLSGHLKKIHRYINEDVVFVAAAPILNFKTWCFIVFCPRRVLSERISI